MDNQKYNMAAVDVGGSPHYEYIHRQGMLTVYEYDTAEDGPECEVITRILAAYPNEVRTR